MLAVQAQFVTGEMGMSGNDPTAIVAGTADVLGNYTYRFHNREFLYVKYLNLRRRRACAPLLCLGYAQEVKKENISERATPKA